MAEATSLSDILDFDSPYHLESDDHHHFRSTVILNQAEDNYAIWKLSFKQLLRIKNKFAFVDGTLKKPEPSSPLYKRWKQCNALVMCWMWNSMTDALGKRVILAETAQNMWEDLRKIFVPNVDLKIYEVRQRIAMLKQDGDSVEKYFEKLERAWLELSEYDPVPECSCGGCKCEITKRANEARDKEERYAFLMGLNKRFSAVRMQIMLMKPPPSIYIAYAMVNQEELMISSTRR